MKSLHIVNSIMTAECVVWLILRLQREFWTLKNQGNEGKRTVSDTWFIETIADGWHSLMVFSIMVLLLNFLLTSSTFTCKTSSKEERSLWSCASKTCIMGNTRMRKCEGHSQGRNQETEMSWKCSTELKDLLMRVLNPGNTRFPGLGALAGAYALNQMCLKSPSKYLVFKSLKHVV